MAHPIWRAVISCRLFGVPCATSAPPFFLVRSSMSCVASVMKLFLCRLQSCELLSVGYQLPS